MIRVVTFKWSDPEYRFNHLFRYGAEHVNRWARAVRRNLTIPHELVVVTDDPTGITEDVRIVPLWDDLREMGGCYTRLRAFAPDMAEVIGERFVWMDLDGIVVGSLNPLFSRPEEFVAWSNGVSNNPYCGSMVMMTAGVRRQVWDDFRPASSPLTAKRYVGTDQAWIAQRLGPNEATWTQKDGVLSRYDIGILNGLKRGGYKLRPRPLPNSARIVYFHGPCDPSLPDIQRAFPWIEEHWR